MSPFPEARVLDVDLSSGTVSTKNIPGEIYRLYPGGSALGLYLFLNEIEVGIDPLSSSNVLVMAVSPLTGLPISGLSRVNVTTKSPLTGAMADSQAGGFFPVELKASGWEAVMFRGRAPDPVYLYINGDQAELRSAASCWGKVTGEAEKTIRAELDQKDIHIAQIGPAGERRINMMRFFNAREGFDKKDDILPERIFKALSDGPSEGVALDREDFESARDLYYRFAGWDPKSGHPSEATLKKLSLGWLLDKG